MWSKSQKPLVHSSANIHDSLQFDMKEPNTSSITSAGPSGLGDHTYPSSPWMGLVYVLDSPSLDNKLEGYPTSGVLRWEMRPCRTVSILCRGQDFFLPHVEITGGTVLCSHLS